METNNNGKSLSNKDRKRAIQFIREKQIFFIERWNECTNCSYIVDIQKYKENGQVRFLKKIK